MSDTAPSPATAGGVLQVLRRAVDLLPDTEAAPVDEAIRSVEAMAGALADCREALRRAGAAGELAVVDAALAAFGSAAPAGDGEGRSGKVAALRGKYAGRLSSSTEILAERAATPAGGGGELPGYVKTALAACEPHHAQTIRDFIESIRLASTGSAPAHSAWRPIDSAPKEESSIRFLLLLPSGRVVTGRTYFSVVMGPEKPGGGRETIGKKFSGYVEEESSAWMPCRPTHWQPLPAAPTQEQQG